MTEDERHRLDNHGERLRQLEISLGRNGLVGKAICEERHDALENRMNKVEKSVASMSTRLWGVLVLLLGILAKLVFGG